MIRLFSLYNNQIKPQSATVIDAPGVSITQGGNDYHVALVAHLPGSVNQGGHAVYADVLGDTGWPQQNPPLKIGWTWEGRHNDEAAPPVALDKNPLVDPAAGNVPINKGMILSLWLLDGDRVVSDTVHGLQTAIPDDDPATGNSRFHNSYYVIFRKGASILTPTPPPTIEGCADCLAQLETMKTRLDALTKLVNSWQGD